jgi:hypothetical protein
MNVFAITIPADLIRKSPIQRNYFCLYAKHLPHRSIKDDFAVVGAGKKKNRQGEKEKEEKDAQEKFSKETHKLPYNVQKIILGANCF